MEDDQKQRPESLLPYEKWIEQALRHVVAQAIEHVAVQGLPGGHHFYITFRTDHPGVGIPQRVRAQYPQEMTIVLQHQFWDLAFNQETQAIQVGSVVRRCAIQTGHSAGRGGGVRRPAHPLRPALPGSRNPGWRTHACRRPPRHRNRRLTKDAEPGQVVSLDAFRRRSPQDLKDVSWTLSGRPTSSILRCSRWRKAPYLGASCRSRACAPSPSKARPYCASLPKRSANWRSAPSTTSRTCCARRTWPRCAPSWTTPRRRRTTGSWRWTC